MFYNDLTDIKYLPQNNPADVTLLIKFKGALAKYYDKRLNEIWWVETKDAYFKGDNNDIRPAFPKSLVAQ